MNVPEVYLHNSSQLLSILLRTAAQVLSEESISRIRSSLSSGSFSFGRL